ncbi:formyltransferase family protein [Candidatus Nanosalina sp. VS9-1]|uniref:formyltransferase family protein n=1 Tax=Candidatus Nanosalina sp. VS9-1 TaxID=3388566 RepID=UPI0039E1F7EF
MEAVFLGLNEAGEEVYEWLNHREDVDVLALLTEEEQLSLIEELRPDIVISSGFEHKVPKEIIEVPEKGVVNLHPSFLPYNRGSHPYIWPIIDGTPAGVSVHYMNEEIDEGPIIDRMKIRKRPDDDSRSLRQRLMKAQADIFVENWERIKEGPETVDQSPEDGTTHFRRELDEASRIDTEKEMKVGEFIDLLRALSYTSDGLAWFEDDGERFFLNLDITPEKDVDHSL